MSNQLIELPESKSNSDSQDDVFDGEQFLGFVVNNEFYGINILSVQEIRSWQACTQLPNAPEYLAGVINIRGDIIPVIDLGIRLGMNAVKPNKETAIVVLNVIYSGTHKKIGAIADSVFDVFEIDPDNIKAVSETIGNIDDKFVKGLCQTQGKTLVLLNVEQLLDLTEVANHYAKVVAL